MRIASISYDRNAIDMTRRAVRVPGGVPIEHSRAKEAFMSATIIITDAALADAVIG
jgi:hypothetical protein